MERKALETEQKARSEVDQEVLVLRGQVLGTKELNTRLREQVTRQEVGLQSSLETLEMELKALESEQKARSEVD